MCILYLSTLFDSWVWMISFKSDSLKSNSKWISVLHLLYMFSMVGLHMFYSMLITLMLVNKKLLGKHAYLSSWCLRYGLNDMMFALYCLSVWELYLKIWKTLCEAPLWYAKVLPKPYVDTSWKPYTHMLLVFALSFVKLLWPSREILSCFHDQDSRAHHISPCYASMRS